MALTKATNRMIDGAAYHVNDFGAVGDGVTDDSAAIQLALNELRDNGGTLTFSSGATYRCNSGLTLELTSLNKEVRWNIEGRNAEIIFPTLTSGNAFKIGADGQTNFPEFGSCSIYNLSLIGPEPGQTKTQTPTSSTIGLFFNFAHEVLLTNVQVRRFYTGIKTGFVFPLAANSCLVHNNFIGLYLSNSSNIHQWINLGAKECRYGVLIFEEGLYGGGRIDTIAFHGLWFEGSLVGVHVDTGTNPGSTPRVRSLSFYDGFYGTTYDQFRFGLTFDFATYATRTATRTNQIYGLTIQNGRWGSIISATSALIVVGGATVYEAQISIPYLSDTNAFVGSIRAGQITFRDKIAFTPDWDIFVYDNFGNIIRKISNNNGAELTIASGAVSVGSDFHVIDTEGDASSDDLDTINGGFIGMFLLLKAANDARTVVVKDGTGNLKTNGDFSLTHTDDTIALIYDGTNWLEVSRSDNAT